jgi:hypothetical protein
VALKQVLINRQMKTWNYVVVIQMKGVAGVAFIAVRASQGIGFVVVGMELVDILIGISLAARLALVGMGLAGFPHGQEPAVFPVFAATATINATVNFQPVKILSLGPSV